MFHIISKFLLCSLWGWKITVPYPKEIKKSVIMVMPHTSYWDFPIGILLRPIYKLDTYFVAKHQLFWFPLGHLMRAMGGVAVNRTKISRTNSFIDQCAVLFDGKESFKLTVAPEGTRQKVKEIKKGFYFIAVKAGVPIVPCKFDWSRKIVAFSEPFFPTGNYELDLQKIMPFFIGTVGKHPALTFDFDRYKV